MDSRDERRMISTMAKLLREELREAQFSVAHLVRTQAEFLPGERGGAMSTTFEQTSETVLDASGLKALHDEGAWKKELFRHELWLSAPFRKCTKTAVVEVLVTSWHLLRYLFESLSSSPPDGLGQALHPPCARHFQTDRLPTISRRR